MSIGKKLTAFTLAAALCGGAAHAVSASFDFDPSAPFEIGDVVTLDLVFDSGTDPFAVFGGDLTYDVAALEVVDITIDPLFPFFAFVDPADGPSPITIASATPAGTDASGEVSLFTASFRALAEGVSTVAIDLDVLDGQANPLFADTVSVELTVGDVDGGDNGSGGSGGGPGNGGGGGGVAPVPVPAALAMLLSGLALLPVLRSRRKTQAA